MALILDGTSGLTTPGVVNTAGETIATTLAVTGVSTFAAGTALLPALTTTGDTNTGLWFPAADTVAASTGGTERMRIDSSGNLLVGTTSVLQGIYGASIKYSNNVMGIQRSGGTDGTCIGFLNQSAITTGSIYNFTSSTNYNTTSDYRLKENIAPMTGALTTVSQLKPVTYSWKADGSDGQGFIAHELQAVVPDCVTGEKDAVNEDGSINPQGIDTSFLVATLTAAIQEQQALIIQLQADVAALKALSA